MHLKNLATLQPSFFTLSGIHWQPLLASTYPAIQPLNLPPLSARNQSPCPQLLPAGGSKPGTITRNLSRVCLLPVSTQNHACNWFRYWNQPPNMHPVQIGHWVALPTNPKTPHPEPQKTTTPKPHKTPRQGKTQKPTHPKNFNTNAACYGNSKNPPNLSKGHKRKIP